MRAECRARPRIVHLCMAVWHDDLEGEAGMHDAVRAGMQDTGWQLDSITACIDSADAAFT